jgi:hypothetical protein
MFANAKAQAWWSLRVLATFRAVNVGKADDPDAIISLNPTLEELRELKSGLSQKHVPTQRGRQGAGEQSAGGPRVTEPRRLGDDRLRARERGNTQSSACFDLTAKREVQRCQSYVIKSRTV